MKIEEKLPQFVNNRSLFLVAGRQVAVLYEAEDGEIEKIGGLKIEKPIYSDKEGYFQRSGRGGVFGSGSDTEMKTDPVETEFLRDLKKMVKIIPEVDSYASVYIFAQADMMRSIEETLPPGLKEKVKKRVRANVVEKHPFELLKRLKEDPAEKRVITNEEVKKILDKGRENG